MSIDKMREEFEAAFVEEMVARCGEGYRSSVEFFFVEKEPDGTYSNPIAHAGWWAWKASRAALVIELPVINERDWAVTSDECSAMREGIEIMSRRVEATGCKVSRPPKPSAPERKCPGCGAAGFTANCDQCIPY